MNLESKAQLLEKEKAQVMYDGLKQQLNPHFLFNSLTSLSALIENDQELASQFLSQMSDMYRYILKNANEEAVPLQDELNFVDTYVALQKPVLAKVCSSIFLFRHNWVLKNSSGYPSKHVGKCHQTQCH